MGNARIVFADGSKHMAHNTNDLMFRWHERKSSEAVEIMEIHHKGITIRDCSNPRDLDEANAWKLELSQQKLTLDDQLRVLKQSVLFGSRKFPHVTNAIEEIMCQQGVLRNIIKMMRIEAANVDNRERNVKLHTALVNLCRAVVSGDQEAITTALTAADEFMPRTKDVANG